MPLLVSAAAHSVKMDVSVPPVILVATKNATAICEVHVNMVMVVDHYAIMLDKSIEHGKEHRKNKYRNRDCRPHGSCPYCHLGRQHKNKKYMAGCNEQIKDYKKNV